MRSRLIGTVLTIALGITMVTALPAHATVTAPTAPTVNIVGNATTAVYSYANAIRETVYVTSTVDGDGDGKLDKIAVDIVRPSEPAAAGQQIPAIMEASPYYQCCGRGNQSQKKAYDANGNVTSMPLFYDNYFVPLGYAFIGVDLSGTSRSQGCPEMGGPGEIAGAKAVIDWLNGRANAVYANGTVALPTWSSGHVGMIGKSWDGTIANGVAATGVAGLDTIVPISSISSWYDYTRYNGVDHSRGYVNYLDNYVSDKGSTCTSAISAQQTAADDSTANLNPYFDARNYRTSAASVHASVFVVHGVNDRNVTTNQFGSWWSLLAANNVPRKLWLSQEGHVDPFDFRRGPWVDELHKWFDYWLYNLPNGVMGEPQASIERTSGTWVDEASFPTPGAQTIAEKLGQGNGVTGLLNPSTAPTGTRAFTDKSGLSEATATSSPTTSMSGRLVFLSAPLTSTLRISGNPSVTLRFKLNKSDSELTAKLVDYGSATRVNYASSGSGVHNLSTQSCWGSSTSTDSACYTDVAEDYSTAASQVLTRGWYDAAHYSSLRAITPLTSGVYYTLTIPLSTYDVLIASGHQLGLVITASDTESTSPSSTGATVTIDLTASYLNLPISGADLPIGSSVIAPKTRSAVAAGSTSVAAGVKNLR